MLHIENLRYWFEGAGEELAPALEIDDLHIDAGQVTVIRGPSGSGKTTLLYLLAGLHRLGRGRIVWDGLDLSAMQEGARDRWRRENAGFVFQDFNLIPEMNAVQNVTIAAYFAGWSNARVRARAVALLGDLGVPVADRPVSTCSRGEQQRIALARALVFDPAIVFADEPTASLDAESSVVLAEHLNGLAAEGRTVIVVSHDPVVFDAANAVIGLDRGRVVDLGRGLAA